MEVRRARDEDASAVAGLWTGAYCDDPRGGRVAPYGDADFHQAAAAGEILVADDGGELAGVVVYYGAGVREGQVASGEEGELSRLAVAPRFRRGGLGRQLAGSCLQLARERGATAVVLWSRPHQVEAHRLYESLGFSRLPARDGEDPEGSRLVFALPL